jgi:hypothetical protein
VFEAQDTALSDLAPLSANGSDQALGEALVGSVLTSAWPSPSTATQSVFEAQETEVRGVVPSIAIALQAPEVAVAGLVLMSAWPSLSTATQSVFEAQDTALSALAPLIANGSDQALGPAGWVLTIARPAPSTATQSPAEAQEIPLGR